MWRQVVANTDSVCAETLPVSSSDSMSVSFNLQINACMQRRDRGWKVCITEHIAEDLCSMLVDKLSEGRFGTTQRSRGPSATLEARRYAEFLVNLKTIAVLWSKLPMPAYKGPRDAVHKLGDLTPIVTAASDDEEGDAELPVRDDIAYVYDGADRVDLGSADDSANAGSAATPGQTESVPPTTSSGLLMSQPVGQQHAARSLFTAEEPTDVVGATDDTQQAPCEPMKTVAPGLVPAKASCSRTQKKHKDKNVGRGSSSENESAGANSESVDVITEEDVAVTSTSPTPTVDIRQMVLLMDSNASLADFVALERFIVHASFKDANVSTFQVYFRTERCESDRTVIPVLSSQADLRRCSDAFARYVREHKGQNRVAMVDLFVDIGGRFYSRDTVNAMTWWHDVAGGICGVTSAVQRVESCRFRSLDVPNFLESARTVDPLLIARLLKTKPLRYTSRELSLGGTNWLTSECMNRTIEMIAIQSGTAVYVSGLHYGAGPQARPLGE
ncbi:hypothetical protein PybrP1_012649 [[Pythium] brassicae (nom. inval.)]|nr:hypothetical protein PybrP1_012649 [[Pythium] brassicae (nom. inval.)]